MPSPIHNNPIDENAYLIADRTASAPYNFVPLPEEKELISVAPETLPDQDRFHTDRKTGYFEVELEVKSPLYVRCALPLGDFLRSESEEENKRPFRDRAKNKPDFFYTHDPKQPVIPGSSLRGMLRNLLEVVSYGKMEWVTEKQLFFRTMDPTTVGDYYRGRMSGKVEAGFLRREGHRYFIKKCECVRVFRTKLGGKIYDVQKNWETPRWNGKPHQHIPVWIRTNASGRLVDELSYEEKADWREGRLVITGNMKVKNPKKSKKKEFVFLLPESDAEEILIPDEMLERFHDDDQITQWQQKAFPAGQPKKNCRERDGFIMRNPDLPGDSAFFLRENGELTFFGRAQMFRLPYQKSPLDFVPTQLREKQTIDLADAIFGYVKGTEVKAAQGSKARAYASRVFITDAKLVEGQSDIGLCREEEVIVPRILASPKPTAFQHYLVQTNPNIARTLYHYGSRTTETVIRGHKFYWHQGRGDSFSSEQWQTAISEEKKKLDELPKDDTQHTQFKPVKPGTQFKFSVYFENLSEVELGALCWVLQPLGHPDLSKLQKELCHHLGMGKPLGMGSVKLKTTLYFTDRETRYKTLFNDNDWHTGLRKASDDPAPESLAHYRSTFERQVLEVLKLHPKYEHLYDVKRIAMLLKLMEWPGYPAVLPARPENRIVTDQDGTTRPNTRYMTIRFEDESIAAEDRNEYRHRPVLPDPSAFGGLLGAKDKPEIDDKDAPGGSAPPAPKAKTPKPPKQKHAPQQSTKPKGAKPKSQPPQPSPPSPPAPAGFSGTKEKVWVTIVKLISGGKVQIQTEQGEEVPCTNLSGYSPLEVGQRFRANVTYEKGKARKAVFKGWK